MAKKKPQKSSEKSVVTAEEAVAPVSSGESTGGNRAMLTIGRLALFAAALIALYLMVTALSQGQVAGCEEGKSCDKVLSSKWAKLIGIPIGAFGAVSYLAMLGLSFTGAFRGVRWFLAISIIGGALWFTGVQAFALKTFCPWCCGTHALAVLGTILVMAGMQKLPGGTTAYRECLIASSSALAALAVTAVAQVNAPDPEPVAIVKEMEVAPVQPGKVIEVTVQPSKDVEVIKEKRTSISLHERFELSTVDLPSMGDAQTAEHVAVGIFDFSCKHCRELMKVLKPVVSEYGDQLAVLKLPGHFNQNGREIQKLMLPVFREAPEVYDALGEELYKGTIPAVAVGVRQELERRLGAERLEQILAAYGGWAEERVAECKAIIEANRKITKSGKLPQLIAGKSIETGNKSNAGHYHKMFADNFGLTREHVPELVCSPEKLDLGKVVGFSQHNLKLTLSNPGKLPVTIDAIKRPKGIVVENVPKLLQAGASQEVTIKLMVPNGKNGELSTYFEVHSNAGEPIIRVPFTADVVGIKFDPPVLNFGAMEGGGEPKAMQSTVTFDLPARITAAACPIRFFKPDPPMAVEEMKSYKVRVTAQFEEGIVGIRNTYAVLQVDPQDSSVPWPKEIRIPIKARVTTKKTP